MDGMPGFRIGAALAAAYFLGSLPFAAWVARLHGVDITKVGSGNPGMTNVWRTLGWKPALPVALLDAGKGYLAAWLAMYLTGSLNWALAAGLVAVLGHSFTCFAAFKGGKGVLTGFGVFLYFTPLSALAGLAAWAAVVAKTRYVSLGSIIASVVMPMGIFLEALYRRNGELYPALTVAILVGVFVLYRHRANIARLTQGTENKIGSKAG
ncbi:MAG TPA: glycerol-3-phosphate 1-O-acyltransferase PlsY [Fibrobacteria bacterium]|nr:glycerol-3-phosphate 1-O-acyltransferase PlsY [Fibrobacteria bacterium]